MPKGSNDEIVIPVEATEAMKDEAAAVSGQKKKVFSEDEVEQIRKQEKDKLYKRLEEADTRVKTMEEQMAILAQERETARKEAEERAQLEAETLKKREEEELSAKELLRRREEEFDLKLKGLDSEYSRRFQEIEEQRQAQAAILEKERRLQELNSYRQRRLSEEQEAIVPELLDLVSGNNEEEIENSIAVLRERSSAILESIQQATQQQQGRLRGVSVTAPPVGPTETQTEYQTLNADDIRNMTMDQYAKMRERLLNARPNRGRF